MGLGIEELRYEHTVYLHRDAEGAVLYVGCTYQLRERTKQHRRSSPWRDDIASVEVVRDGMWRYDALDLERELIQQYRPRHNYSGTPEWVAATGARLTAARRAAAARRKEAAS